MKTTKRLSKRELQQPVVKDFHMGRCCACLTVCFRWTNSLPMRTNEESLITPCNYPLLGSVQRHACWSKKNNSNGIVMTHASHTYHVSTCQYMPTHTQVYHYDNPNVSSMAYYASELQAPKFFNFLKDHGFIRKSTRWWLGLLVHSFLLLSPLSVCFIRFVFCLTAESGLKKKIVLTVNYGGGVFFL